MREKDHLRDNRKCKIICIKQCSAIFVSLFIFSMFIFIPFAEAAWEPILVPMSKNVPLGFQEGFMLEPNVMLLLDTSGSMTFRTEDDTSTRGDGTRPAVKRSGNQYPTRGVYFGEDLDVGQIDNNNDPLDPDNYHPLLRYIDAQEASADWPQGLYSRTLSEFDEYDGWLKDSLFAKHDERYLFPNDSRLYKLKLVLWRIFNDPSLVSNIRMGLSTYYQYEGFAESDWYEAPEDWGEWYWIDQDTYWTAGSSTNYALLREEFLSTNDQDHMDALKKWVDGAEYFDIPDYEDNHELRADGNTPLASSIYNSISGRNCAYDFFAENGVIQGWCQDNYLIVLTDGADTDPHIYDPLNAPVNRVKQLYDESQNIGTFHDKPNSPVKTLVIGFIDPEVSGNTDLKNTLNNMADVGWDGEIDNNGPRGEGTSNQAYFANDVDALIQAFRDIFILIQEKSGTAGAPLISPGSKTGEQTGSVYVASFVPKPTNQWEGKFYKYALESDGISGTPDWEAGSKLNTKSYSSRSVYTVDWNGDSNLTNFNDINDALVSLGAQNDKFDIMPAMSNDDWQSFVRWVLGSQEYDPNVSERWKLSDIYHSGLTEVGIPQALTPQGGYTDFILDNASRDKVIYVQANDGMLHAFNAGTTSDDLGNTFEAGDERWAFIPPNVLHSGRLIGLRGTFSREAGNSPPWQFTSIGSEETRSIPRYLMDGPLVAEDVYDESSGEWRTVLLGLLGYAGAGMYCMDITDPDSPEFLWAIDNAVYRPDEKIRNQTKQRAVVKWTSEDDGAVSYDFYRHHETVPLEFDYTDLRFTLSVPVIGSMTLTDINGDEVTKWVSLMGNGTDMELSGDSVKGRVYVTDILTGEVINTFQFEPNMKFVVSPVTVLRENDIRRISTFYVGDNNGDIYEASESDNWAGRKIINLNGSNGPSFRMEVGLFGNNTPWLFIITGDQDDKVVYGSNYNHVVALNTRYSPNSNLVMTSDLTEVDPSDVLSVSPAMGAGWYFRLEADEYPATPVKLYNGYLFYSTFIEDPDPCKIGTSRLYVQQAKTGLGGWESNTKYVEFSGVQIRGITISDGKVYVGAIDHSGEGTEGLPDEFDSLGASFENNLLVFDTPPSVMAFPFPIESGQMIPRYWREWIRR